MDCRFIPVRPSALAQAVDRSPDAFGCVAGRAGPLFQAIDRVIEQEVSALHDAFDDLYAALTPDEETPPDLLGAGVEARGEGRMLAHLEYLLDKANFKALGDAEIEAAIQAGTTYGVRIRVDPSRVERLRLHVRGRAEETLGRRSRLRPWRRVEMQAPVYRRLVVATRLRGEAGVRLKLFRDIPVRDVEALMPHAEIRMSMIDRIQVFGAGAGALGGLASKAFAAITSGVVSLFSLASAALVGFGGLAFRSFFGYRRTMRMRTSVRTQHLYERSLANNASVVHALLRMIRQEELKEAALAYACLAGAAEPPRMERELDERIEAWIERTFDRRIDYDCADALETLDRLNLWKDRAALRPLDPDEALRRLERHWASRVTEGYHLAALARIPCAVEAVTLDAEPRPETSGGDPEHTPTDAGAWRGATVEAGSDADNTTEGRR